MIVVSSQYALSNASPAFARARRVNPIIAISLTPYLSPKNPPNICPNIVNKTTIPPSIALYFCCDHPASLMKISTIIGSTNNAKSESKHKNISKNDERVENTYTI